MAEHGIYLGVNPVKYVEQLFNASPSKDFLERLIDAKRKEAREKREEAAICEKIAELLANELK